MNRKQRRELARDVASRNRLKGAQKQRFVRETASMLPGGANEAKGEQASRLEEPSERKLVQRESGLVVPQ